MFFSCVFSTSNILFCHLMLSRGYVTTKLWPRNQPLLSPTSWKKASKSTGVRKEAPLPNWNPPCYSLWAEELHWWRKVDVPADQLSEMKPSSVFTLKWRI